MKKQTFSPKTYTADEMRAALKRSIGKTAIKMKDLAHKLGLTEEGQSVPSAVAARLRVQLSKLIVSGAIVKLGARATTRYCTEKPAKKKPAAKPETKAKGPKKKKKKA